MAVTYDDLPPEVLRVARNFIRGVFFNQEADRPYDEELLAKNVACHVLQAAAWTPDTSHRERLERDLNTAVAHLRALVEGSLSREDDAIAYEAAKIFLAEQEKKGR